MKRQRKHAEVPQQHSDRSSGQAREQRASRRLRLPLPMSVTVGHEDRSAYCRDVGPDSFGIEISGEAPKLGDEITVRLWLGGKTLDAPAWVLRTGGVVGLRCPQAGPIYELLGGKLPPSLGSSQLS